MIIAAGTGITLAACGSNVDEPEFDNGSPDGKVEVSFRTSQELTESRHTDTYFETGDRITIWNSTDMTLADQKTFSYSNGMFKPVSGSSYMMTPGETTAFTAITNSDNWSKSGNKIYFNGGTEDILMRRMITEEPEVRIRFTHLCSKFNIYVTGTTKVSRVKILGLLNGAYFDQTLDEAENIRPYGNNSAELTMAAYPGESNSYYLYIPPVNLIPDDIKLFAVVLTNGDIHYFHLPEEIKLDVNTCYSYELNISSTTTASRGNFSGDVEVAKLVKIEEY